MRVSFASASAAEMREGMARLGRVLREAAAARSGATPVSCGAAPSGAPAATAPAAAGTEDGLHTLDSAWEGGQQRNGYHRDGGSVAAKCAALEQRSDSAMAAAMAGMRVGPPGQPKQAAPEVVPGCQARVDLVGGSPAVTADALAPKAAKTIAPVLVVEQCPG